MGAAGVVADALTLARLQESDAGLRLLRLDLAPFAIAVLARHLGGQVRRMSAVELHELIEEDLLALRESGLDLPQTARAYCDAWRRAGILLRTSQAGTREEIYELSAPTEAALRYIAQLERPRAAVTQSRLVTISTQLDRLVRDTDPTSQGRLESLRAERDALEAEIERVEAGEFEPLDEEVAAERLREILGLAEEVPADFARVRADIVALNHALRERIVAMDASRGEVLDDVFRGVDRINTSEAGRSFLGFHELVVDPEASAVLDDRLATVLERSFAGALDGVDRRFLREWRRGLVEESSAVRGTMTGFSRSLNSFVRSRLFEEHRRLATEIREAQRLATSVAQQRVPREPLLELRLTGLTPASVGAWRLRNPEEIVVEEEIVSRRSEVLDVEAVRAAMRDTEIDLVELVDSVNDALARRGTASIAEVLEDHPATQGLASVLGLVLLAVRHGTQSEGVEEVRWTPTREGASERAARLPRMVFTAPVPELGGS